MGEPNSADSQITETDTLNIYIHGYSIDDTEKLFTFC